MATDLTQTVSLAEISGNASQLYTEPIDPKYTALMIVDMQGQSGESMHVPSLDGQAMQTTLAGCEKLLTAARKHEIKIIHIILGSWTLDGSDLPTNKKRSNKLYVSQGKDPIAMRQWDSPQSQFFPSLAPIRGEIVLQKTSGSAFATTGLAGILHNLGVQYLVCAGQLTDGCLGFTAIGATSYGYDVTLVDGACYGSTKAGHLVMLRLMDQLWGRVRTVEEIIVEFSGQVESGSQN